MDTALNVSRSRWPRWKLADDQSNEVKVFPLLVPSIHERWPKMNGLGQTTQLNAVFDAIPSLILVVDQDRVIQDCNRTATELLMAERKNILYQSIGEIFHCVHSIEMSNREKFVRACTSCIIKNTVSDAFDGDRVVRRRVKIEMCREENKDELIALISASLFSFQESPHVLLVIENISGIAELHRLMPSCAMCIHDSAKNLSIDQ